MDSILQTLDCDVITGKSLEIHDCGLVDYRQILDMQLILCKKRQEGKIPNTILLVEHPAVITLGARQSRNILLVDRGELEQKNIDVVEIRRGGGTTVHNPGQLVIYPILNLQEWGLCIRDYIRKLETIGAELLRSFGIKSNGKKDFPGLWIGNRKIASIGVRVSRFTTYHGMAINIHNDLSLFDTIVPCGLENVEMTSVLKETGIHQSLNELKKLLIPLLESHFSQNK
ncbi:MAG: lipoyl(octanoyl) transferase LipB [Sedimentisphaerales bacterium]|nr:lipoyl(octanoyl) transferase LipB [Sedimentisphaerales bacterium]